MFLSANVICPTLNLIVNCVNFYSSKNDVSSEIRRQNDDLIDYVSQTFVHRSK